METKHSLLIVEDEKAISNLIATTLETQGYHYEKASNGAQALMEITSHSPEIILLDLGLPDMDGVEIIRRVRSWSSVPIIVISARTEDQDKIEALDAGADDYLYYAAIGLIFEKKCGYPGHGQRVQKTAQNHHYQKQQGAFP